MHFTCVLSSTGKAKIIGSFLVENVMSDNVDISVNKKMETQRKLEQTISFLQSQRITAAVRTRTRTSPPCFVIDRVKGIYSRINKH